MVIVNPYDVVGLDQRGGKLGKAFIDTLVTLGRLPFVFS